MSATAAFIHPAVQTATLLLGLYLLFLGLRIRRSRRAGPGPETARLAARHMRLGRWFIALLSAGYLGGLAAMSLALNEPLFGTAHAYFATLALVLFLGTAYLGRRLRLAPGRDDFRQLHSFCAFFALFTILAVAFLGFQLLP